VCSALYEIAQSADVESAVAETQLMPAQQFLEQKRFSISGASDSNKTTLIQTMNWKSLPTLLKRLFF
jgi:hypothetical protein